MDKDSISSDDISRIRELTQRLREASKAYYDEDREIMSNLEYDKLYDELEQLEKQTGFVMAGSPTQSVGYEVVSKLPKEKHPARMLSLDKTKEVAVLAEWLGGHDGILSWKMDGLTVVLTYEDGVLVKAVTRGNGDVGEVITANARTFVNLPTRISCKSRLVIRGEAVISYRDFDRINEEIEDVDARYKNPRNLCSGSVRQLDSAVTAERHVMFYAFSMMDSDDEWVKEKINNSFEGKFRLLRELGFDVVEYMRVTIDTLPDAVEDFKKRLPDNAFPSDGLVLVYDDIAYGRSLGATAKFPRDAIAFKWQDEEAETVLREIKWNPSRTGLINPIAVFDKVDLEGTEVRRASLHNVTYVKEMQLGPGDSIKVYKANMIIPQLSENLTRSGSAVIPDTCPSCGGPAIIRNDKGTETLNCENPDCPAKNVKLFTLFVSRNAMNIDGISEQTMVRFIDEGYIRSLPDIYHLDRYRDEIVSLDGFGEKSYNNIISSVEKSRMVDMAGFLYGLGIHGFGVANAKVIVRYFGSDMDRIMSATVDELVQIDGIGDVLARDFAAYFADEKNLSMVRRLMEEIEFVIEETNVPQDFAGMTFVITGSLVTYPNRDALKKEIEDRGGKVAGSVSSKTTYLINNDVMSNSSKNKKARELGIPVISEEDYKNL